MNRCAICQTPVQGKGHYCSSACRQRAYRQRQGRAERNAQTLQETRATAKITNPPVRYVGGKWRVAGWIIDQFPPHVCYCEPFGGGASVLLQKYPSRLEVLNDLNHDIINFFDVLRDKTAELIRAISLTPYHEEEYRRAHDMAGVTDPLERARRFYVRTRMSFGHSEAHQLSGWRFMATTSRNLTLTDEFARTEHLWATAERLKAVQICCTDYRKVLTRFDTPETLFYIDPPYPASTRYEARNYYRHEMLQDDQHRELAATLKAVQGMVLVSGYECDLYAELFAGWRMIRKPTRANGNAPVTECLWISPAADDAMLPMFKKLANEENNHA